MISIDMMSPEEVQRRIAEQARAKRLALNISQRTLSEKSAVSLGVLKKFEQTGKISLASLLKLALVLGAIDTFKTLFAPEIPGIALSLDALMEKDSRKRGRK